MTLKQMDNPQGHIPSNACERALAGDIFRYGLPAGCAAKSVPRELYILPLLRKIWKILDEYRKSPITIHTGVTVRTGKISGSP
jgi:hypothetical protein